MVGVPAQRVVELRCPYPDDKAEVGTAQVGTGTVIGDRLVLTAAHVVHGNTGRPMPLVRLRRADQTGWVDGHVLWPTQHPDSPLSSDDRHTPPAQRWDQAGGVDVALVRVSDPTWQQPALEPVRFGRLTGRDPNIACSALGFPRVLRTEQTQRTPEVLSGRVVTIGDLRQGRYDIHVSGATPTPGGPGTHPWGGMSGAALFAADLLIGVIVIDQVDFAHDRLTATPLTPLTDQPGFLQHLPDSTTDTDTGTIADAIADADASPDRGTVSGVDAEGGLRGGVGRRLVLGSVELSGLLTSPVRGGRLSPAQLLVAERAVVPWHGRTDLLTELTAWCRDGSGPLGPGGWTDDSALGGGGWPQARLLTGPGGQGKTRLALHLAQQLRTRHGWTAGLLRRDPGTNTTSGAGDLVDLSALAATTVPVLLIVDYAETRTAQLDRLLTLLADCTDTAPIRVLLLARAPGDWYDQLQLDHDRLLPHPPTALPELDHTPAARAAGYHQAAHALARQLPKVDPTPNVDWTALASTLPTPDLSPAGYGSPLTLHLLALTQLLAHGPHPLPTSDTSTGTGTGLATGSLEAELLRHETRYWRDSARARGLTYQPITLARAVAAASLLGASNEQQALTTVSRIPGLTDLPEDARLGVALWLRELYPHPDGQFWGNLQPDRLTEHHLAQLSADDPTLLPTLLAPRQTTDHHEPDAPGPALPPGADATGADASGRDGSGLDGGQRAQALTVLARAAPRHPHLTGQLATLLAADLPALGQAAFTVATQTSDPRPLTQALGQALQHRTHPLQTLTDLADQLPERSLALATVAHTLTRTVVEAVRTAAQHDPTTWQPVLATTLNNLSNRLADLGRHEEALTAIQQSATLYRQLAADRPEAYTPRLASSLNNLSNALAALGRHEEALTDIEQAVTLRRQLADARPDAFTPDLAGLLNNLSVQLAALGRHEEALTAIEQAVTLRRQLADARPDAFTPHLAVSLHTLSNAYADLGWREEALTAINEAVMLHRRLADHRPDAYTPNLASSLHNLSDALAALGRHEEALSVIEQAVTLHRQLADARPEAYTPDLAGSLNNLSNALAALGRHEEALSVIEQAVTLHRQLADARPEAYTADRAMSLNNLSNRLANLGRHEEALTAIEQAVTLYRQLAAARPDTFVPDLAGSLYNLSNTLATLDTHEMALTAITEAVRLRRQLAAARPDAYTPDLVKSLHKLSDRLADQGQHDEALTAVEEAVTLRRRLVAERPGVFGPGLARALVVLGVRLTEAGRPGRAREADREAVRCYRRLAEADPDRYGTALENAIRNLVIDLRDMGGTDDEIQAELERLLQP